MTELSRMISENIGVLKGAKMSGVKDVSIDTAIGAYDIALKLSERCESLEAVILDTRHKFRDDLEDLRKSLTISTERTRYYVR